jgi:hypothetical protein
LTITRSALLKLTIAAAAVSSDDAGTSDGMTRFGSMVNPLGGFFSSPAVLILWEAQSRPCRYPGTTPGLTNSDKRLTDYVKAQAAVFGNDEINLI